MDKNNREITLLIEQYLEEVKTALLSLDANKIEKAVEMLMQAYSGGKRVFILGNGGSAVTASHMACDLGKGTLARVYDDAERRLKVMSLTDNMALVTAYGNDIGFADVFVQQLKNLVEEGDLVIVLSGSGNSKNIVKAIKYVKQIKANTIGLLGFKTGGQLANIVDCAIIVQSNNYGPVEDIHVILNHILTVCFAKMKHRADNSFTGDNTSTPFPYT